MFHVFFYSERIFFVGTYLEMRGQTLKAQAQQLVLNLCEYFELEKRNGGPLEPITSIQEVNYIFFIFIL